MMQIGLIGIGAGAASALLFASVSSGSWLSVFLFYLAPLPIMIAGLGWSHWSALIAAIVGALSLTAIFGGFFFFAFLAGCALPTWWLGYLAMLARPAGPAGDASAPPAIEWYPPGRLVVWAAVLGALTVIVAIPNFGLDGETVRANLHSALARLLRLDLSGDPGAAATLKGVADPKRLIDFLVEAIPLAAAVLSTLTNVLNLWLGARIVKFSGRLSRPWPALPAMTFPRPLAAALPIALVLSFMPGLLGILSGAVTAALLMAFGLLGFAVLHGITRGMEARGFLLGGAYAAVMVFGWPLLVMCILGLVDMFFDLRGRAARKRGPPALP